MVATDSITDLQVINHNLNRYLVLYIHVCRYSPSQRDYLPTYLILIPLSSMFIRIETETSCPFFSHAYMYSTYVSVEMSISDSEYCF